MLAAGVAVGVVYRRPIGAVVTVQRVRRRLQMSRLDSTKRAPNNVPPQVHGPPPYVRKPGLLFSEFGTNAEIGDSGVWEPNPRSQIQGHVLGCPTAA